MFQTTYSSGETIFEEGETGDCAYIIDKGLVEIYVTREHEKIVLAILSDGDIFGEMALISGDVRSASARALVPTTLNVICKIFFQDKLAETDPIVALLMKLLLERFHEARGKLLSQPKVCLSHIAKPNPRIGTLVADNGRQQTLKRIKFINDLQSALELGQFLLYYQPIHELATGSLAGFEALVRWNHPEHGIVPPNDFICIAEDTKDIIPIGYWVFEQACNDLAKMRETLGVANDSLLPWMSINVSPVQLKDAGLGGQFHEILSKSKVNPSAIKIELTESVLVENPQLALLFFREVKRLGMNVSIDDFGTGYSSLSYLHLFPVDILKIDRTFVANMFNDSRSREIVQAIAALSKNLNIDIVAEGVETEELKSLLFDLGCRYGQGYLYSKPVEFETALSLLKNQRDVEP